MASPQRTPEFRAEAVRKALTSGVSRKQIASDLCFGFSMLIRCIQQGQYCPDNLSGQSNMETELTYLQRENRLLREEREVLKKPPNTRPAITQQSAERGTVTTSSISSEGWLYLAVILDLHSRA
jgi:transposase